jgi:hypothetical protein
MSSLRLAGGVCLAVLWPCVTQAGGVAVAGRASTLGVGPEVTARLSDRVNLRVGVNLIDYSRSVTQDDNDEFDVDVRFRSVSGILDFHPTGGGFRLSGGALGNGNKADFVARAAGASYEIGNNRYGVPDVGALIGSATVADVAGYAGVGWGNPVGKDKRVGVFIDLGVLFQGAPEVTLGATGPIAGNPAFQQDLALEEQELNDEVRRFRYYPVISLGVSIKL